MTTSAEDRTIILLRHAEAAPGEQDHERELTDAGADQARVVGRWLREHEIGVDAVLCSTALRARETVNAVGEGGCCETDLSTDPRIYQARPDTLVEVLREADPDAAVVMLVGHAPALPALASILADGQGSTEAHEELCHGFPPATVAVLRYSGHWSDLAPGTAVLDRVHCPATSSL